MKSLLFGTTGTTNLVNSGTKYGLPWGFHGLGSGGPKSLFLRRENFASYVKVAAQGRAG
jgi:hypothetical protein